MQGGKNITVFWNVNIRELEENPCYNIYKNKIIPINWLIDFFYIKSETNDTWSLAQTS